ncbi:MAG: FAD-dependent oxidoreductase, partial [Planctomycetes bacterium]|nr:FAD-dependent oxidoreductase [Planctomycetota bacterium]
MIETSSPDPLLDRRRFLRRAMEIGTILPTLAACRGPGSIIEPPSIHPRAAAPERPSDEESSRVEGIPHDLLAIPDFSRVGRFVAGIRPFRRPGVRIERETLADGRPLVHHYGHGGAGVTVSWGTAEIAADRVEEATDGPRAITVLGAGVIGLSTASVLRERGHEVRIVAAKFLSETTSFLAGAQWAPSWIKVTEGLSATLRR